MDNTTGYSNIAYGANALHSNTSGFHNTAVGISSLYLNSEGIDNTAIGVDALFNNSIGNNNTAIGMFAGNSNIQGSNNVFLGSSAGYYETESNKLYIDNQQRANESDARDKALIYGVFDADPINQVLKINGMVNVNNNNIINLADPVNPADAATKSYVDALLNRIQSLELITSGFTDPRDGNHYKFVKIGNQVWMAENLKYLPEVVSPETGSSSTPYYYVYGYIDTHVTNAKDWVNYQTYGVLYNWPAALQACPAGWHLPTDAEWTTLENYLITNGYNYDGTTTENKIAKSLATPGVWNSHTGKGTIGNTDYPAKRNATGFSALPGGGRGFGGTFDDAGYHGTWWSASESSTYYAWLRRLYYSVSDVNRGNYGKDGGFYVRCLRDN